MNSAAIPSLTPEGGPAGGVPASTEPRATLRAGLRPTLPLLLDPRDYDQVRGAYRGLLESGPEVEPRLHGVLRDALENPGGLLRGQLAYGIFCDGGGAPETGRCLAAAVEYFHTASLIFDDLPSMDAARERRGRACAHLVHGEAAAILGALALITRAYSLLWRGIADLPEDRRRIAGELVGECLGLAGILGGQALDLGFSGPARGGASGTSTVETVAQGKTGSLFRLCLELPALMAGADPHDLLRLRRLACAWGGAYQALDDFRDLGPASAASGKTAGRDEALGRPNLALAGGLDGARARLHARLAESREQLRQLSPPERRWRVLERVQAAFEARSRAVAQVRRERRGRPPDGRSFDPLAFAAQQLRRWSGLSRSVVITVPAPPVVPEEALRLAAENETCFFWSAGPPQGCVGLGIAHLLEAAGSSRFLALQAQAARLRRRLDSAAAPACRECRPRLFGGFAFEPGAARGFPWESYGDARFVLPRLLYERGAQDARLSLTVRGEEVAAPSDRRRWLSVLERALGDLAGVRSRSAERLPAIRAVHRPPLESWCRMVEDLRREIASGRLLKAVAARSTRVELEGALPPAPLLAALAGAGRSYRFAFRWQDATFLGASPERLVALEGLEYSTEALAGTVAAGQAAGVAAGADPKLLLEHQLVVDEIERRLAPLSSTLEVAGSAHDRRHGGAVHLRTPVQGHLARRRHLLELAAALHPTPAVGGLPAEAARRWIARHEAAPRGWYAGPVGWFDTAGDGELAVALRCGLLHGAELFLFAGAGIVAGSDPLAEAAEVEIKEATLLAILEAAR